MSVLLSPRIGLYGAFRGSSWIRAFARNCLCALFEPQSHPLEDGHVGSCSAITFCRRGPKRRMGKPAPWMDSLSTGDVHGWDSFADRPFPFPLETDCSPGNGCPALDPGNHWHPDIGRPVEIQPCSNFFHFHARSSEQAYHLFYRRDEIRLWCAWRRARRAERRPDHCIPGLAHDHLCRFHFLPFYITWASC